MNRFQAALLVLLALLLIAGCSPKGAGALNDKDSPVEQQQEETVKASNTPVENTDKPLEDTPETGGESQSDTAEATDLVYSPDGNLGILGKTDTESGIYEVTLIKNSSKESMGTFKIVGQNYGFLWSPDSGKVCVSFGGRIWSDFCIIDPNKATIINHPSIDDILRTLDAKGEAIGYKLNENRPDPYLSPIEWSPDSTKLLIFYQWVDTDYQVQNGTFVFEPDTGAITRFTKNPPADADNLPPTKPDGFRW